MWREFSPASFLILKAGEKTMTENIFAAAEIAAVIFVTVFIIKNKRKNVVYPVYPFVFGLLFFLYDIAIFILYGNRITIFGVIIFLIFLPFVLWPVLHYYSFDESGFERNLFFTKKQFRYEEITGCEFKSGYKIGKHYIFNLGVARDVHFTEWINVRKFILAACEKYRAFHNGMEIPGIESFPDFEKYVLKENIFKKEDSLSPDSNYLRPAETNVKERIFLETDTAGHHVCYRRVGRVNELVIDGFVYDEYVKLMEFSHELSADVGGYNITAGFDSKTAESYIAVDGICIDKKRRLW